MDLTDVSNSHLRVLSIPVRSAPNGLLFGWNLSLYRDHQHYSTLDIAPNDWEDHWLQAFCPLYDLETADREVILVALIRDTNWKFDACTRSEGILAVPLLTHRISAGEDANVERNDLWECEKEFIVGVCGFHLLMNPGQMGLYNDSIRNQRLEQRLDRILHTPDFAPVVDIGDDSFLATLCAMKLPDNATTSVYSFEPRELSRLRWQAISESNGVSLALIAGHPSNPQVAELFGEEGIRNVLWNGHNYQMEDHCVMEALSYWCMVNSMRGTAWRPSLL